MKILVAFSCLLAVVLVSGVTFRPSPGFGESNLILKEILRTLTHLKEVLKTHDVRHKLIVKVIDEHKCKPENFCKVEKVLSAIDHDEFREKGKLVRQLKEYNGKRNCSIEESTEVPLFEVLRHLRTCVQKEYSHN